MNEMMNVNEVQTMSSREIAELTGKLHRHVCRDIRVMLCSLYGGSEGDYIRNPNLVYLTNQGVSCIQYDTSNPNGWEYCLDKDNTLCLVSGYNAQLRMKIIKRWQELEGHVCKPVLPDFTDPVAAARAWADEVEQKLLAQKEVERLSIENKQALDYVDRQARYIGNLEKQLRDGLTLPEFAKRLNGVNVQKINAWASKAGWMHKHGKLYMTSSLGRSKGFVYDKDGTYTNNAGEEMWTSKVQLTNDGARKVYREYLKLNLPMKKSWNGEFSNDPFKDGV